MIKGLVGAQLLNLSAAIALKIICSESDGHTEGSRALDFVLVLGGALACFGGMVWFLDNLGPFALFVWPLSCIGFVMGVWTVEERARSLLGFVSLVAGGALLLASSTHGFFLHHASIPPHAPSFCPGCTR
jgi:hypothetical protein